ncbi:MAG TPA: hypothetical protein VM659_12715 [Dongiaceae bacterium]|nr:hypothetical protein [Dongiaceae bacterium]
MTIWIDASSRDMRLTASVACETRERYQRRIAPDTQPVFILENPIAFQAFRRFLQDKVGIDAPGAEQMLEHCRNSFIGIFTTLDRQFRLANDVITTTSRG